MLNHSRVLEYIKVELGFPYVQLELEDSEIIHHFTTYTLREFSRYVPEVKKTTIDFTVEAYKVPNIANEFYIVDPENIEILNVVDVYFGGEDYFIQGHPFFGPFSHYELREWALQTEMANQLKMFSSFDKTFSFQHPNIVRISPIPTTSGFCVVEYERMQPVDLRGIPNEFQMLFSDLALADVQIIIGRIRSKYSAGSGMRTPFGEIPIGSEILEEGKEKKREILEVMTRLSLPNVVMDMG